MRDWQATKEVIVQAEAIKNHFAQQKLSKPTLIYQHNMGCAYMEKRGTSDEVKKVASKLGLEVDAMRKEIDEMHRETRQGFAVANQKFEMMNTNMTVITSTLSTLHSQLQNTTHTMLGQRKEKMISDKAHTIDMRLFDLERMFDKAQTNEDRSSISAKIKHLEEARERLRGDYKTLVPVSQTCSPDPCMPLFLHLRYPLVFRIPICLPRLFLTPLLPYHIGIILYLPLPLLPQLPTMVDAPNPWLMNSRR